MTVDEFLKLFPPVMHRLAVPQITGYVSQNLGSADGLLATSSTPAVAPYRRMTASAKP